MDQRRTRTLLPTMMKAGLPIIAVLGLLVAGCQAPTEPGTRGGASPTTRSQVSYHGIIYVPTESEAAIQGRRDPWFVADQGDWLELILDPPFAVLADPGSAGRDVTLTGDLVRPERLPVGAGEQWLHVTDFRFDSP